MYRQSAISCLILTLGVLSIAGALLLKWNSLAPYANRGYCRVCGDLTDNVVLYSGDRRAYYCKDHESSAPRTERVKSTAGDDDTARGKRFAWDAVVLGFLGLVMCYSIKDALKNTKPLNAEDTGFNAVVASIGLVYYGLGFFFHPLSWKPLAGIFVYLAAVVVLVIVISMAKRKTRA
jgi:hypothetical protein